METMVELYLRPSIVPWGVDVLVFLMIKWLDKLALCRYITNHGNNCNDVGRWNKDTPCVVIQNMGGGQRKPTN